MSECSFHKSPAQIINDENQKKNTERVQGTQKIATPATFLDTSAVRANLCKKFCKIVNKKTYT